jgi:hypothetical protein
MKKIFIFIFVLGLFFMNPGPVYPVRGKHYTVTRASGKIKIDGVMDEAAWQQAVKIGLLYEWMPGDNIAAPVESDCRITFSKTRLYIGIRCFDPEPGKIRAHLMDRDAVDTFVQDDYVSITIDTFNDERRAFQFSVNPLGVQADAYFSEPENRENFNWDAIWNSAAKITARGYTVEIAIPFSQLRFPKTKGKQTWGISIERSYPRKARHRLSSHPRSRDIDCILCQEDKISGFENISPGKNIEFDPTLTLQRTDRRGDFPAGKMETGGIEVEPGISARWGITPNIALNSTINPDFSHVEADAAQLEINTRFALRYPEKRPFFLEGADYFQTPFEAVFTRTVFDPLWGVKLTGKQGRNAFGFIAAQDRTTNLLFPANQRSLSISLEQDVLGGVFRYRGDVGKGSMLGILYTGRVGDGYFNHMAGLDGFLRLSGTKSLTFQVLQSHTRYPEAPALDFYQDTGSFGGTAVTAKFRHMGRHLYIGLEYEDLSPGFRADYGFIPRVDVRRYLGYIEPVIWGKPGAWFEKISFQLSGERKTAHNGNITDQGIGLEFKYAGPLQIQFLPALYFQEEFYNGVLYDKVYSLISFGIVPFKGLRFSMLTGLGTFIDYTNFRLSDRFTLTTGINFTPGKHLIISLDNTFDRLSHEGNHVYTANLLQSRMVYNFNVRTFIRFMLQYTHINRNIDQYLVPSSVEAKTRVFFTQFLFSYKINPRTVLFLGYSDDYYGFQGVSLTRTNRTFFLKIGYALVL